MKKQYKLEQKAEKVRIKERKMELRKQKLDMLLEAKAAQRLSKQD